MISVAVLNSFISQAAREAESAKKPIVAKKKVEGEEEDVEVSVTTLRQQCDNSVTTV
jgi:hypothetical protein